MAESSPKGYKTMLQKVNSSLQATSPFATVFSKSLYCRHIKTRACLGNGTKLKQYADDNLKFDKMAKSSPKW